MTHKPDRKIAMAAALMALLTAGVGYGARDVHDAGGAPQPLKPISVTQFYVGRWYEIARTPMRITRHCVAGTTDYSRSADGRILDTDACRMDTPQGRLKTFVGPVTLLNPGENTKMRVSYIVWHIFRVRRRYWILDHDSAYRWFILSDPSFEHVSLFSRDPQPPATQVARMREELRLWGYDLSKLETPAQFSSIQAVGAVPREG